MAFTAFYMGFDGGQFFSGSISLGVVWDSGPVFENESIGGCCKLVELCPAPFDGLRETVKLASLGGPTK
jgi:hypothetical protein